MDERRLLLAVALSLLVLTAHSLLFPPARRPKPIASPPGSAAAEPAGLSREGAPPAPVARVTPPPPARALSDEKERRVEATSRDLSVAFTNRGARLVSWKLLRFADGRGRPEEMVQAAPSGPRPLDLETGEGPVDSRLREALFRPSTEALRVGVDAPATLRFEFADGELAAEKEITFSEQGYLVVVKASVRKGGQPLGVKVLWGPGVGNPTDAEREVQGYQPPQGVALAGGGVEHFPAAKLAASGQALGAVRWAGVETHYFAALFVPPSNGAGVGIRPVNLPVHDD